MPLRTWSSSLVRIVLMLSIFIAMVLFFVSSLSRYYCLTRDTLWSGLKQLAAALEHMVRGMVPTWG
jgi:hypothetical protein